MAWIYLRRSKPGASIAYPWVSRVLLRRIRPGLDAFAFTADLVSEAGGESALAAEVSAVE